MSGKEILLRARQHFRASRTVETLHKIHVPEWEADIYYWPEMSVEERRGVYRNMPISGELTGAAMVSAAVDHVRLRSRNEHGDRLFSDEDESALIDTAPHVLARIAAVMGWGERTTLEGAEKN